MRDDVGEPERDVDAAAHVDQRLRRSEALRRFAGKVARVGGWSIDATPARTVYWSEEIFDILAAPNESEPLLEQVFELYPERDRERITEALNRCFATGESFDIELEIDTFDGRRIPVRAIGEPERDQTGDIVRVVGAFQDISDVVDARSEAHAAAARLVETLENMSDAVYVLDDRWHFTFLNRRAEALLRRDRSEVVGANVWVEFPEAVDSVLFTTYHRARRTGETEQIDEFYYPPLDTWFQVAAYPSNAGLAVYFRDVTEAHETRIALDRQSRDLRRQADLLDAARDGIIVRSIDGTISFWSRGAERIYGWSAAEAIGRNIRDLLHEDAHAYDSASVVVAQQGHWTGELLKRSRTGDVLNIAARWTLILDEQGQPESVLSINTDVTDQRRIEQQLLRAQRLESIGTLAGGISHDLNNVLSPIVLAARLLLDSVEEEQDRNLVATIERSARRGADLVTQVLSFARGVEGQRTPVNLAQTVENTAAIIRDTFPKSIQLAVEVADDTTVIADATQIQQVLMNLAVNARDAMPNGGRLSIVAREIELDIDYVSVTPGSAPGRYALLDIEDSGIGMPAEVVDRIFEPFFTTKPQGAGTGLGLSTLAAIVRSHGGFVRVYSEPGRGSRFRVYLPAVDPRDGDHHSGSASLDAPRGNGETVLVIDDEAAVRAMTRQTLEVFGYRVLEASNGAEGIAVYLRHADEVAVVLTDMMMPVMDGPATVVALRNLSETLPIIGASGLHGNGKVALAESAGAKHFLPKPYTSEHLLALLAEVLRPGPRHDVAG